MSSSAGPASGKTVQSNGVKATPAGYQADVSAISDIGAPILIRHQWPERPVPVIFSRDNPRLYSSHATLEWVGPREMR